MNEGGYFIKSNTITRGALVLALIFISFSLFKGTMNIVNAVAIPSILYFLLNEQKLREIISMAFFTILFTALFFRLQIFFIPLYCLIALTNIYLKRNSINTVLSILLMTTIFSIGFWGGIQLTDAVFLTQIERITQRMMGNTQGYYLIFLISQGLIIALSQIIITRKIENKYERLLN